MLSDAPNFKLHNPKKYVPVITTKDFVFMDCLDNRGLAFCEAFLFL